MPSPSKMAHETSSPNFRSSNDASPSTLMTNYSPADGRNVHHPTNIEALLDRIRQNQAQGGNSPPDPFVDNNGQRGTALSPEAPDFSPSKQAPSTPPRSSQNPGWATNDSGSMSLSMTQLNMMSSPNMMPPKNVSPKMKREWGGAMPTDRVYPYPFSSDMSTDGHVVATRYMAIKDANGPIDHQGYDMDAFKQLDELSVAMSIKTSANGATIFRFDKVPEAIKALKAARVEAERMGKAWSIFFVNPYEFHDDDSGKFEGQVLLRLVSNGGHGQYRGHGQDVTYITECVARLARSIGGEVHTSQVLNFPDDFSAVVRVEMVSCKAADLLLRLYRQQKASVTDPVRACHTPPKIEEYILTPHASTML
ncbi:hypothetical protein EJ06DRAFT_189720 [Trichodelitschia bisporula]|uniref:Uncharacterized protein n=1 Tax=Trichodelitschia bisporula TaxID=703511 RepID=A0A6G1I843_9PEZI|nr:hypothetical protein EJ06DRAFT_189720 [Trichodelitschia bisporula]